MNIANTADMALYTSGLLVQAAAPQPAERAEPKRQFQDLLEEKSTESGEKSHVGTQHPDKEDQAEEIGTELVQSALPNDIFQALAWDPAFLKNTVDSFLQVGRDALNGNGQTNNQEADPVLGMAPQAPEISGEVIQISQTQIPAAEQGDMGAQNFDISGMIPEKSAPQVQDIPTTDDAAVQMIDLQQEPAQDGDLGTLENQSDRKAPAAEISVGTAEQPLFRNTEAMPVRIGEAETLDTAQENFTAGLSERISSAMERGAQRVEIHLSPENLGNVVVEMTKNADGSLHIALHAETARTAQLLDDHSAALGLMLQNSGQGDVTVEVSQPRQDSQPWQQPDQDGGQGQNGQSRQQRQDSRRDTDSFLQQLRLGLSQQD